MLVLREYHEGQEEVFCKLSCLGFGCLVWLPEYPGYRMQHWMSLCLARRFLLDDRTLH